jgi:hypothetical protein
MTEGASDQGELLTSGEVADLFGVQPETVRAWAKQAAVPAVTGRLFLVHSKLGRFEAWLSEHSNTPPSKRSLFVEAVEEGLMTPLDEEGESLVSRTKENVETDDIGLVPLTSAEIDEVRSSIKGTRFGLFGTSKKALDEAAKKLK